MAASTLTMAKTVSLTDYQPAYRVKADKRTWKWESVYKVGTTSRGTEQWFAYSGLPLAQLRGELEPVPYYDVQELGATTLTVVKYLLGARFSNELINDNQHLPNLMREVGAMIGESHAQVVDDYTALPFNRAWASTYQVVDPVNGTAALCASHTLADGSTYSNLLTAAAPDTDVLLSALSQYEWSRKNHAGLLATDKPNQVLFSSSKFPLWNKLLNNSVEPDTVERNDSFIKGYGLTPIVCPFLDTTTNWFILGDNFKQDAIFLWRERMKVDEAYQDKDYRAVKIPSETRFGAVVKDYLSILGNAGA